MVLTLFGVGDPKGPGITVLVYATAGAGNRKVCIFKGGRQLRGFNRLNCICMVSVFTVAAPYICVIVTGSK